jgi:hypothetical protein
VTLFVVCGKANFTNLSRYGEYSERTYRRQYQKSVDFIPFHAQTIAAAIEPSREQIAAIDCSFISKSGKQTWGIDNFYNSSISKSQKGLEISVNYELMPIYATATLASKSLKVRHVSMMARLI